MFPTPGNGSYFAWVTMAFLSLYFQPLLHLKVSVYQSESWHEREFYSDGQIKTF